jgi:hypothetical protein
MDTGASTDSGGGNWVDMTNNPSACHMRAGVACGWASANNNSGFTCACRHGTWAEGWSCEAPNAPVSAGPSCPGVVGSDGGAGDASANDSGATDAGAHDAGNTDAGGWVDMSNNAAACDHHDGTPCGWSPTPNGAGYTCACRHGTWADGWTCEAAGSPVTPGPSCP